MTHNYATVNVKFHIPFTLDLQSNYSKWVFFFKSLCGKFGLRSHVDGSAPPRPDDPQWDAAECCVRGWISGSVDDSVLDLAMDGADPTARDLWVAIEGIFRANREPRAIFLLNEFHSMVQGDSTISAYCQQLKTKAAALRDVGHPVEDSQLVLALLRGLNPRFSNTADDIANSAVLPTFARAHDMLALKELRLANDEKTVASTALLATAGSGCTSPGGCHALAATATSGGAHNPHVTGYGSSNKGGGGGNSSGGKSKGKGRRGWNSGPAQQRGGVASASQLAGQNGQYRPMVP